MDLSKYILDASTLVLSLCLAAVPITSGVAAILPRSLHGACRQLASPFEDFLTLEDLQESPGNIVDVSKSKTQILVASACLVSISSLVSLLLQLHSGDPQSTLYATVLFVAWVSLTCCYFSESGLTDHHRSSILFSEPESNPLKRHHIALLFSHLYMRFN